MAEHLPEVLVVGSIHLDRMMQLSALPMPGETVIARESWTQLGGKAANQAMAAAVPGVRASLVACVGDDHEGREAEQTLTARGVRTLLQIDAALPTGSSAALLDAAGENVGVIVPGANTALRASALDTPMSGATPALLVCQWETRYDTLHAVLQKARTAGVPVLMNAAPWQDTYRDLLPLADHVVVNAVEAHGWTGTDPQTRPNTLPFGHPSVIVTLGAGGVLHYRHDRLDTDLPAPSVEARSTHGAGDHFVGVLAAQLAQGSPPPQALERATESAAHFVQLLRKHPLPHS
ncbi:PfkB family carbohydrate kinase [Deinococcus aquiradiocola]|uniref:Ribokinase n=1 Tax=Deinococcus aquiradiocola TaxID=393059 RepID=A0A917P977_9DEIO|nr:PfkB family carbohydrate kinase [Deinococcus aquiradiocola]GGJ67165.1 ribokinase [Deinococcus aquiradiocola]